MTFAMTRIFPCAAAAIAAACALALSSAADAQVTTQSATSADGLLTVVLSSANASDTAGVNNTYTWTAINNSPTVTLQGVVLGSHWGDWCGGGNCTPPGPTLIALGAGCAGQGPSEIPPDAHFGAWCSPVTGVALAPGQSISGSVTLRPGAGGPPDYTVYSLYDDPVTGRELLPPFAPMIRHAGVVAPAPTDIQIKGAASNGSPAAGSTFSYAYEVKNAGPWGTYGGVTFADTLPDSLTLVSVSVSPRSALAAVACGVQAQTVTCPLNEMQAGGTTNQATVTLTVTASGLPQQVIDTAWALTTLPQADSNGLNNAATVIVTTK